MTAAAESGRPSRLGTLGAASGRENRIAPDTYGPATTFRPSSGYVVVLNAAQSGGSLAVAPNPL